MSGQLSLFTPDIPFQDLDYLIINSPELEQISFQIKTQFLQLFASPNLLKISDLKVTHTAKFGSIPAGFETLGVDSRQSVITSGVDPYAQNQIIQSSHTHRRSQETMQALGQIHDSFRVDGFSANLPSEIILDTNTYHFPLEHVLGPDGEDILKTRNNKLSEFNRLKGDIFEYLSFVTLSLLHPEHRLYREFCPLIRQLNGTYTQGFRVDCFINGHAYECKWFFLNAEKINGNRRALDSNGIELKGIISRANDYTVDVPFQPINELAEPLTHSSYPGVASTIQRCLRLLDNIQAHQELPANAETLANGLYNIVDQAALKPAGEKQEFITEHINGLFDSALETSRIHAYSHAHDLHFPPMDDECTFLHKDHLYQSFAQPRSECGDPTSLVRSFEFSSGLALSQLKMQIILSDLEHNSAVSNYFVSGRDLPALVMAQNRTDRHVINRLYQKVNSHQASLLDVYTLLDTIPTITHRLFARNNQIYVAT